MSTTEIESYVPKTDLQLLAENPDPTERAAWPALLPIELALAENSPREICSAYDLSKEDFLRLTANPTFQKAYQDAKDMLQKEGMAFRVKARMQAEALLPTSWKLIHSQYTPANIKAKLIEATWRVAGFEPKETDRSPVMPLQINIQL